MSLGRVVITGGTGFLGWHLACRLRALDGVEPQRWGRPELMKQSHPDAAVGTAFDTVFHVAGVNRAAEDAAVEEGNIAAARALAQRISEAEAPVRVVYANSIHAESDSAYGRGKRAAAEILGEAADSVGGSFVDVLLPNLFGEHGRPGYNSFVATFAAAVVRGEEPTVDNDAEIPLLHAQSAAECLRTAASGGPPVQRPDGTPVYVSDVLARLKSFHALYATRGEVPDVGDAFDVDLFNTYRSHLFPDAFPIAPQVHADPRGRLFETARVHGGGGQSFVSSTVPGATRGDHYHLSKIERFFVVSGTARISLRRLLHDEVVSFELSGDTPAFVDMPTLWTHNITNIGATELVTMFWADQLLDPANPDQYPESVEKVTP